MHASGNNEKSPFGRNPCKSAAAAAAAAGKAYRRRRLAYRGRVVVEGVEEVPIVEIFGPESDGLIVAVDGHRKKKENNTQHQHIARRKRRYQQTQRPENEDHARALSAKTKTVATRKNTTHGQQETSVSTNSAAKE